MPAPRSGLGVFRRFRLEKVSLVFGYACSTVLLGVGGLAFIPAVIYSAGPDGWAFVAIGQSVGIIVAVIVGYGWSITGPAAIANLDARLQIAEFRRSLLARVLIGLPAVALGTLLLWLVFPDTLHYAAPALVATAATGLSSNWLFVGMARPFALLWCETVPRSLLTGAAILSLYTGWDLPAALVLQGCGMLAGVIVTVFYTMRVRRQAVGRLSSASDALTMSSLFFSIRQQSNGMVSSLISVLYVSAPIFIVGFIAPASLPAFALADKIQKQFMSAVAPIVSVAQGWVPNGAGRSGLIARSQRVFVAGGALSFVAAACTYLVGPALWSLLGSGQLAADPILMLGLSAVCGAILWERIVGRACLVPLGGSSSLMYATAIGSLAGIASVAVFVLSLDAAGALAGVLLGLLLSVAFETLAWRKRARGKGRRSLPVGQRAVQRETT